MREAKIAGGDRVGRLQGRQCRKIAERTVQTDAGKMCRMAQGRLWEDAATQ